MSKRGNWDGANTQMIVNCIRFQLTVTLRMFGRVMRLVSYNVILAVASLFSILLLSSLCVL